MESDDVPGAAIADRQGSREGTGVDEAESRSRHEVFSTRGLAERNPPTSWRFDRRAETERVLPDSSGLAVEPGGQELQMIALADDLSPGSSYRAVV